MDSVAPRLSSPALDMRGYKRGRARFDWWYFDNSTSSPGEDFGSYGVMNQQYGRESGFSETTLNPTGGWSPRTLDLSRSFPMAQGTIVFFKALDRAAPAYPGMSDHVVEAGVDNVRIEEDRQICDVLGVNLPPNGIGHTLRVNKNGADALLSWTATPVDATHQGAAYYRAHGGASPSGTFSEVDTTTGTQTSRALVGPTAFYLISAVNAAGTSGDEPAP